MFSSTEDAMAKCTICGKGPSFGHNVSHANNKTAKVGRPNIQRVKTIQGGTVRHVRVCTQCIKSGRVVKSA
jgi:large subunit ribosomal protein L28